MPHVSFLKCLICTEGLLQSPMLLSHWSACLAKFKNVARTLR